MEDLAIIERIRAGDRDAFVLLVERHQSAIFRIVRKLVPDAAECEDLAQDVFLTAFAKLAAFDPGRAPGCSGADVSIRMANGGL